MDILGRLLDIDMRLVIANTVTTRLVVFHLISIVRWWNNKIIFQLSGVALVIVGVWTLVFENKYSVLLGSSWFLIIVGLMIGTGGLIIIVCICGCYGVVKEHRYFLISVSSYHCYFRFYSIAKNFRVYLVKYANFTEWAILMIRREAWE